LNARGRTCRLMAVALAAAVITGCVGADAPPDMQGDGVPIVGNDGSIVGTADSEELEQIGEHGTVDVFDNDGERVGSFSPTRGFTPS
jgi:hypothetical protein